MRKYQYQIYYHTSRGRYFIKIRYSFLGLVFWLTLRDKYSSNIETFLDKDGNAFSPNYSLPDNEYFTTKTTGLGSYTLTKVSTPPVSNDTPILSSRFNPTKKYPLDLNFYWASQKPT